MVERSGPNSTVEIRRVLERVEELREARGVNKAQLFRGAVDLFVGKAPLWFRSVRKTKASQKVGIEFLHPNYDEGLRERMSL